MYSESFVKTIAESASVVRSTSSFSRSFSMDDTSSTMSYQTDILYLVCIIQFCLKLEEKSRRIVAYGVSVLGET